MAGNKEHGDGPDQNNPNRQPPPPEQPADGAAANVGDGDHTSADPNYDPNRPDYEDAELAQLVRLLLRTALVGLADHSPLDIDDPPAAAADTIRAWLLDGTAVCLCVRYDDSDTAATATATTPKPDAIGVVSAAAAPLPTAQRRRLCATAGLPRDSPLVDLAYFLRPAVGEYFRADTFNDRIVFGTLHTDVDGSMLRQLQLAFAPHFFGHTAAQLSDNVRQRYCTELNAFMAYLTQLHHKLSGCVVLYLPGEALRVRSVEEACSDRGLLKRLDDVAAHWVAAMRTCLNDRTQLVPYELQRPPDQYEFYTYRYEVLRGLQIQIAHVDYQHILSILKQAQSIFVKQLNDLSGEIDAELERIADTLDWLELLVEPCKKLMNLASTAHLPAELKDFMHLMRVVWERSKYFNTRDTMTLLFRLLSNQIIIFARCKVDVHRVLSGYPRDGLRLAHMAIDSLLAYRLVYDWVKQFHLERGHPVGWDLDEAAIFNHVDAFRQRLNELLDICNAMIVFGRIDETATIPAPLFGGIRGPEFEAAIGRVEQKFAVGLQQLRTVEQHMLDVHSKEWQKHSAAVRHVLRSLEEIIENLTTNVFVSVCNVDEGLEALCALYYYSKRPNLRVAYLRKVGDVWQLFADEMETVNRQLMAAVDRRASWQPALGGRASSLKLNADRLRRMRDMFVFAEWLPECSKAKPTLQTYDDLERNLMKGVKDLYDQWLDTVEIEVADRLNSTLMKRSRTKKGMLECNIDFSVLEMCAEANYFEMLGYQIPGHIKMVHGKYETIKLVFDSVVAVVTEYNRVLDSLSEDERRLFAALVAVCERRVRPGVIKLTWSSDKIDVYVAECVKNTRQLQDFVDVYKTANRAIQTACEQICDTMLMQLAVQRESAVELESLQQTMEAGRKEATRGLIMLYKGIVDMLMVVHAGFETQMDYMVDEWLKYVQRFDLMVQEALHLCGRQSLLKLFNALHGDDTLGPSPLLNVTVDLVNGKLVYEPSVRQINDFLNGLSGKIIDSIRYVPRLTDKLRLNRDGGAALPEFYVVCNEDIEYDRLRQRVLDEVVHNQLQLSHYGSTWSQFKKIWETDRAKFMATFHSNTADEYDKNIQRYEETAVQVNAKQTVSQVYFLEVDASKLKASIRQTITQWTDAYKELLKVNGYDRINEIYAYTRDLAKRMLRKPRTLDEMQDAMDLMRRVHDEKDAKYETFPVIKHFFVVMDKYDVIIPSSIRKKAENLEEQWRWFLDCIKQAEEMLDNSKDNFKLKLLAEADGIRRAADQLMESLKFMPTTIDISPSDALGALAAQRAILNALYEQERELQAKLGLFGINLPDNPVLREFDRELAVLEEVWGLAYRWESAWLRFKDEWFWDIQTDEMDDVATELLTRLVVLYKQLKGKNWEMLVATKVAVDEFRKTLPLLVALKNQAMRTRHWDKVREMCGVEFDEMAPEFTLDAIVQYNFQKQADAIMDLSYVATMELQAENNLKNIRAIWTDMAFDMQPHGRPGVFRLAGLDDALRFLEEHAVLVSSMKSTRFVEPFMDEVNYWEKTLNYVTESLDIGLTVQRQWMYLEVIFSADDIRKQMVAETAEFDALTEEWADITSNMNAAATAIEATHYQPPNYLLDKLLKMSERLELIERALELYLETKRHLFPRFYFISNDDMLEMLGNAKKPLQVQAQMRMMFDNVYKLNIKRAVTAKSQRWEAYGMYAVDGEYVTFSDVLVISGPAESWLAKVESAMRVCLKEQLRVTRKALKKSLSQRDKWLAIYPGQLCLTSSKMQWTSDCTRNLTICRMVSSKLPLKKLRRKQNKVLAKLSDQSRKDLAGQMRLKVNTLITIEIHGRDVIDKMYKMNCTDVTHFEWFSQLRFYWDKEHDDCNIKQTNTHNWYLYEYTGNSGRLVITPLTDRCYMTLTTALHLFRGGSPKGPAGTGKTETVKDLGKALGMWVIVNNCSDTMDYKSMAKCFSGLAQTGAWGCFDEFNRINIEVLSVVSQQVALILGALSQGLTHLMFEGYDIHLKSTVGLFITMNPGYAGRTELPDNLKSMFRPISMMVPDNIIIAENCLFSDGFSAAKKLAKKVFTLYELAKQQLSKQPHYDFGLRSMVALLRYAGSKRRQLAGELEERVVYLAMKDMNVAKLTADDGPLFESIMSDIFPGVTIPNVDYAEFYTCLEESFRDWGLQPIPTAVRKAIQLYETKNSRHSVMLLGDTGTAKSATWKVLKRAFGKMKALGKEGWVDVVEYPMNPKSMTGAELYGEFNLATGEWTDGVLSNIMRRICNEETSDQKWMLFDGPVDAVWIENMNSVMDDNKMLTLVNSERIVMPKQVSLLFEVADLAQASPATVSRCGMVYNDYKDWGWRPYVESWLQQQKSDIYRKMLRDLFDEFFDRILNFKRLNCGETIPTNELNNIQSFCRLMNCLSTKANGIVTEMPTDEDLVPLAMDQLSNMVKLWFMFCMIWSLCATVNDAGRAKLDTYLRELDAMFPLKDTIYDYYVDVQRRSLAAWEEHLDEDWRFDPEMPYYKIVVPTVDTIRYDYVVAKLIANEYPALLTGPVGTGKTSVAASVLANLDAAQNSVLLMNMSAQTSPNNVQEAIEARLEKRTKAVYVPMGGKRMICFMDDMNMPAKDTYGSQCALELVREWIDYEFWYNRQTQQRVYVKNMLLLAAMGPAGGGRQVVSPRTVSRFNVINMTFPTKPTITRIFGTLLHQQLSAFDKELHPLAKILTAGTIDLFGSVVDKMLPTPAKMHYLFNLRDISRVFQGLLRSSIEYHTTKQLQLRLWIHECFRVFSDRLVDDKDCEWFLEEMNHQIAKHLELTLHNLCPNKESPVFGAFVSAAGHYEDLRDGVALRTWMQTTLEERNAVAGTVPMDLVLFREAIEHVTRIVRVISQPLGHVLLVGIGGSGRQSLAKLATYIVGYSMFSVEVTKRYGTSEFREDLKKLYAMIAVQCRSTVFMFNDTQIQEENFMVILNNMLSAGEVAGLYKGDEFEEVKSSLEHAAKRSGVALTTEAIYGFFLDRARANLHMCMCMSPIGAEFRVRVREYPALVNCTTIDWFKEWPEQALLEVGNRYLQDCVLHMPIEGTFQTAEEKAKEKEIQQSERAQPAQGKARRMSLVMVEDRLHIAVATAFAAVHTSVSRMSRIMFLELKRMNYVTATNFLDLVSGYKTMLAEKRHVVSSSSNKLRNGLAKIETTRVEVESLAEELVISTAEVEITQQECDAFIETINLEQQEAAIKKEQVEETKKQLSIEKVDLAGMEENAQKDLQKAMPALNAAEQALLSLNKKDLTEVKSYAKPPIKVQRVMEAVMILLGKKPDWATSKQKLGEQDFLDQLKDFDKNHISEKTIKKIVHYTQDVELEPDKVGTVSAACKSLILWVRAIEKYAKVYKIVGPKIELVENLQAEMALKEAQLAQSERELAELLAKLAKLEEELAAKLAQKEELIRRAEILRLKLERARLLVDGLASERLRWIETVKRLDIEFSHLPGDCLLATAFISYLGPFMSEYRSKLIAAWLKQLVGHVPVNAEFNIQLFCADAPTIREWNIRGLPSDEFSTENAIMITTARRWPLIIDPQTQAVRWIKNMERMNDLQVIDFGDRNYIEVLEMAMRTGKPVLLQNVQETLDPVISPILSKSIVREGALLMMRFNERIVVYNDQFRLFITTKLSNPHYGPETSSRTTVVNFIVKEIGLEAQLLSVVVRKERPAVEEQKDSLVTSIAKNKRILQELENEILRMLNDDSRGNILDDEELFSTLMTSKQTSAVVKEALAVAEVTEVEIDAAREEYRAIAIRASVLFFVLMDMSKIDPMYQFSLEAYVLLFVQSIERSTRSPVLAERITALNNYHTFAVYNNTCRALFERHKLLFSAHMCSRILAKADRLNYGEFNFLLNGSVVLDRKDQMLNPCPEWISGTSWDDLCELDRLPGFHGLTDTIEKTPHEWRLWYTTTEPEIENLVGEWQDICSEFQRMLIIRCLRPDRTTSCLRGWITTQMGLKYTDPPALDLKQVWDESTARTPLIFVLSPGADPSAALSTLAESADMLKKFHSLSLGQGQAPIATALMREGRRKGHWIYLANCHLSLSWMPALDKMVDDLIAKKPHKNFRLWLSSDPSPSFPISILQAGIKMTTEPPKGLRANLKRMYTNLSEEQFGACEERDKYQKLLFGLCFFHCVLLERRKFQQLGFNVVYSFNDADFDVSENLLSLYLDEYPETPWDALKYLIAAVNYGGHITDDWDRRVLSTYINQFFCESALKVVQFKLSPLSAYYIPRDGNLESYLDYINLLPAVDQPEAFGQHANADISALFEYARSTFATMMLMQADTGSASDAGMSPEEKVSMLAADLQDKVPKIINYETTAKLIGPTRTPLDVVLLQEIERYNILLKRMTSGLHDLQRGLRGLVVMSTELEEIYTAMQETRTPGSWLKAYASLKPLGSWARDLIERIRHFAQWAETVRAPVIFWLSAFTFPTGFLTAVLQSVARRDRLPIDNLGWEFVVSANAGGPEDTAVLETAAAMQLHYPNGGITVRGIFLEGAGWNRLGICLREPATMELICTMPVVHFRPVDATKRRMSRRLYTCPCYYLPMRSGSFVIGIEVNAGVENPEFWVKRGTAFLLSLPQ